MQNERNIKIHNYADAIWLSIAYSIDSKHPLKSALEGKYYIEVGDRLYNINFYRDAIHDDKEANTYYYRYWHGTILFLRPLLTQFTYMDIRYMNILLLMGLCFTLLVVLQSKLDMRMAVIFAVAILSVGFYAVPYCIEYVPMFYIMFIASIAVMFIDKCKGNKQKALFFVEQTLRNNWPRAVLLNFLDTNLYERQGKAISNFEKILPDTQSDLAQEMTKDSYNFDFLTIRQDYDEKELKDALMVNVQSFLLELRTGFAFVCREYRLEVGETEQFLD